MSKKIISLLCVFLLTGCSSFYDKKYNKDNFLKANGSIVDIHENKAKPFSVINQAFLGTEVKLTPAKKRILDTKVSIDSYNPVSLSTVLDMVSQQTGVTYNLSSGLNNASDREESAQVTLRNLPSYPVKFTGRISGLIEYISNLYNINVDLNDYNILTATLYKNFTINLDYYGDDIKYSASLDVSSNEGTSGAGFTGNTSSKFTSSFWADLEKLVSGNISSGVYTIFKDASILTFAGTNSEYEHVKKLVSDYQKINSKQFIVSYKIYVLDKNKTNNIGFDIGVNRISETVKLGVNNTLLNSLAGNITLNIANPTKPVTLGAKLDALYELTGKEILQSGTFVTKNNMSIPLNLTTSTNYVSGRTRTTNEGVVDSEIKTDKIVTGTSFIITPRVLSDGNIEVVTGFTKSTLDEIKEFGSAGNDVMLPTVSSVEMFNTSMLKPGGIEVVSEFNNSETGNGSKLGIVTSGINSSDKNNTTVMVIGIDYYDGKNR